MNKIAKFEKISEVQLYKDAELFFAGLAFPDDLTMQTEYLKGLLEDVPLPKRSTRMSAGYDIYSPIEKRVRAGETFLIPTGLRCVIKSDWVLTIFPRSGLGFKYGMRLVNTCGVIDADYCNADNEGHILLKFVADKDFAIHVGDRIAQGIFLPYGITVDDEAEGERTGGFGSTGM